MATATTMSTTEVIASANDLLSAHSALIAKARLTQQQNRRHLSSIQPTPNEVLDLPLLPSPSPSPPPEDSPPPTPPQRRLRPDLPPIKRARALRYHNYAPEEETIRNDYSQRYVDGGEWPQNWVLGAEPERRFEEYPKQQRLLNLKKISANEHSLPPSYLPYSQLSSLNSSKFDVILLDPPFSSSFTWENLQDLPVPSLAADPSFVFLWVGSGAGEGLERGREVLAKWGYRRCEDVVWVKTNKTSNKGPGTDPPTTSLLTRTKQHCLMGIRGTVRRSTDSWFVHCNVDTDVIIWEGDPSDPTRKPPEMYTLIENFCLGLRRLELFARPSSLRRGWVSVLGPGQEEHLDALPDGTVHVASHDEAGTSSNSGHRVGSLWNQQDWDEGLKMLANGGKAVVPVSAEIDALRPKSPVRGGSQNQHHHQGSGGGGGGGQHQLPPRFQQGGGGGNARGGYGGGTSGGTMMGPPAGHQPQMVPMQMMGVDDMMAGPGGGAPGVGGWNGGIPNMGGMVGGMNPMHMAPGMGMMGMMNNAAMMGGMGQGGMGDVNMAGMAGNPQAMGMMNQMNQMGQMAGMNPAAFGQGMQQMFNPAAMGHFGAGVMEGQGWDQSGDGSGMAGMPNMMGGMNMGGMPGMGMGMGQGMGQGQWGGPGGNF